MNSTLKARLIVCQSLNFLLLHSDSSVGRWNVLQALILSHWKEHCQALADKLAQKGKTPFILSGGLGKKERTAMLKAIQETPRDKDLIVVATGQYVGEGFDCPQLDTLFMAFPVAYKGKLIQYVGRIMRELPAPGSSWQRVGKDRFMGALGAVLDLLYPSEE